jgi:hypothetical protein
MTPLRFSEGCVQSARRFSAKFDIHFGANSSFSHADFPWPAHALRISPGANRLAQLSELLSYSGTHTNTTGMGKVILSGLSACMQRQAICIMHEASRRSAPLTAVMLLSPGISRP